MVQYFANSTGIDDAVFRLGKLGAELGIVAASGLSVLQTSSSRSFPVLRQRGNKPQELGHQHDCPYGEERKGCNLCIGLSVSPLLTLWEEIPYLPRASLLHCKERTGFLATSPCAFPEQVRKRRSEAPLTYGRQLRTCAIQAPHPCILATSEQS